MLVAAALLHLEILHELVDIQFVLQVGAQIKHDSHLLRVQSFSRPCPVASAVVNWRLSGSVG